MLAINKNIYKLEEKLRAVLGDIKCAKINGLSENAPLCNFIDKLS
jgi:hypothetical protein